MLSPALKSFSAEHIRTKFKYSVAVLPVAFLNSLQKYCSFKFKILLKSLSVMASL